MRQVDFDTGLNLREKKPGRVDNKTIIREKSGVYFVELWGNVIACYDGHELQIDSCGYYTLTTTNRLNGILNAITGGHICRKGGKFYISGKEWDGERLTFKGGKNA